MSLLLRDPPRPLRRAVDTEERSAGEVQRGREGGKYTQLVSAKEAGTTRTPDCPGAIVNGPGWS